MAYVVWKYFGDVPNYIEPFAGSLSVLLSRPSNPQTETVNDLNCYLANFWRALAHDPEALACHADWPVNEADLHARHKWLTEQKAFSVRMRSDPEYYDVKIAGWWVWGICCWMGSGWCEQLHQKRPTLGTVGMGIHAVRCASLAPYFHALAERLRQVRVCCGDWSRVVTPAVMLAQWDICAVFLDPPYDMDMRDKRVYVEDSDCLSRQVREWAIANGDNPQLRIALCGYEGEHDMPASWRKVAWKAKGGFGSQAKKQTMAKSNRFKERIWFSPHCLQGETQLDWIDGRGCHEAKVVEIGNAGATGR